MSSKINSLMLNTKPGGLVLNKWMSSLGISSSLVKKYQRSGWLKKLDRGVYYRPDINGGYVDRWAYALAAAQQQLKLPIRLAGLSSLTHQGLSHYLALSQERVWVATGAKPQLPPWFNHFNDGNWLLCPTLPVNELPEKYLKPVTVDGQEIQASSPELAAYELVYSIGKHVDFLHAAEVFQGLVNLSPRKVQYLLEQSRSIVTNRLFLFLANHYHHQWARRLDESTINLGSGKRQVVANGRFDPTYQITIPEAL